VISHGKPVNDPGDPDEDGQKENDVWSRCWLASTSVGWALLLELAVTKRYIGESIDDIKYVYPISQDIS
jgi:hypothetical protein